MIVAQDYLHSLGKGRTAQVQKDARIGEALNKRDAVMRVSRFTWSHHLREKKIALQIRMQNLS